MNKKLLTGSIAAATLIGSVAYVLAVPGTEPVAGTSHRGIKGDRLDIRPLATSCSEHAWPYYNNACLRDRRRPGERARAVRVVSADRLSPVKPVVYAAR
jgi:hypothetical protein